MEHKRFPLGFFPTPLHFLPRLSAIYPGYRVFIKRDDQTGLAGGGNKTRKLEYLVREALDSRADTVITAGAQQSNHCRQTAAACAVAGLECHLLLGGEEPDEYKGNLLLSSLLGANIHFTGENRKGEDIPRVASGLKAKGKSLYVIPYGGSNLVGALGYVNAVKEVDIQLRELGEHIDYIFFASSSGGMQAGLMLGMELYGCDFRLVPVSIDKSSNGTHALEGHILDILEEGSGTLNISKNYTEHDIPLDRSFDGAGYGVVTENEVRAMKLLACTEGILLDPVYTGRAFHGMTDYLENHKIPPGSNVLFWHTGGLPAIFYYGKGVMGQG